MEWSKQIWLTAGLPWKIKVRISLPPPVLPSTLPLSNCRTKVNETWFEESVLVALSLQSTLRNPELGGALQTTFLLCQPGPLLSSPCKGHWRKTGTLQEGDGTCSFRSISCSCQCHPSKGHWPWQQQLVPVSRSGRGAPALLKNSVVALLYTPALVVGETVIELGTLNSNEDGRTAKW